MLNIQATGSLYGKQITIQQISKVAAKKLFEAGTEIYLQTSNFAPFGIWQNIFPVIKDTDPTNPTKFESIVNSFTYYNCNNETGKYAHFYKAI